MDDDNCVTELELGVCSLREVLDASLLLIKNRAIDGGVKLTMQLDSEFDERIVIDRSVLKQIMFSLLANAVRFTAADGTVDVAVVRDADSMQITVSDSGVGIREDQLATIFDAVPKQESESAHDCEDPGLSLALTRQLVELHGGSIKAESEPGTGSNFSFTLPLRNSKGIT